MANGGLPVAAVVLRRPSHWHAVMLLLRRLGRGRSGGSAGDDLPAPPPSPGPLRVPGRRRYYRDRRRCCRSESARGGPRKRAPHLDLCAQRLYAIIYRYQTFDIRRSASAKWGVYIYAKYAEYRPVSILHIENGFAYFLTYFLHILHIILNIFCHILHIDCIFLVIFCILFCIFIDIFCIYMLNMQSIDLSVFCILKTGLHIF